MLCYCYLILTLAVRCRRIVADFAGLRIEAKAD